MERASHCLFLGCLTSQHQCISGTELLRQFTCCHTEIEVQIQLAISSNETGTASPSTNPRVSSRVAHSSTRWQDSTEEPPALRGGHLTTCSRGCQSKQGSPVITRTGLCLSLQFPARSLALYLAPSMNYTSMLQAVINQSIIVSRNRAQRPQNVTLAIIQEKWGV